MASAQPHLRRTASSGPGVERPSKKRSNGAGRSTATERRDISVLDYIRQHPIASAAIAVGIGAFLQTAVTAAARRPAKKTVKRKQKVAKRNPASEARSNSPRTHHFGAADMKFTTRHPDGKNVEFKFAWKKRPTDAPETDWPTDKMGFTAARPNGKHTAFEFKGKTRAIPDDKSAVGDNRPGLGWAEMEFTSSAPGRKDFTFNWSRTPPDGAASSAGNKIKRAAKKTARKGKSD